MQTLSTQKSTTIQAIASTSRAQSLDNEGPLIGTSGNRVDGCKAAETHSLGRSFDHGVDCQIIGTEKKKEEEEKNKKESH